MMFYEDVFRALNGAKIKYVVAGGVAVAMHGYPRFTKDLDVIVYLEQKNLSKFFDTMIDIGYLPRVPVTKEQFIDAKQRKKWQKDKGMIVFSFCHRDPPFKVVDMFVTAPINFQLLYKKRVRADVGNMMIPLISIEHLKILKKKAGRFQDKNDIIQLIEIERLKKNNDKN
jgi:hypothetical protein